MKHLNREIMEPLQSLLITLIRAARAGRLSAHDFERVVRRQYLIDSLFENNLNLCRTALDVGLHRNTLTRQLRDLDINVTLMRRERRCNKTLYQPQPRS